MDDAVKVILKKLDDIDGRLKSLEGGKIPTAEKKAETVAYDPLFAKAVEIMDKFDEISALQLMENLKLDKARAEKLLDQLETAGYGTCYFKEA